MNKTNSIHRSTLQLTANALQGTPMRKTQPVIRTIKFRVAKPKQDATKEVHLPEKEMAILEGLFNAFEAWRGKKILKELNEEFELDRAKFLLESAKRNQGYYNTRFVKGKKEDGLPRALRTCYAFSLPQEIKSFRTRYEKVVKALRKTYRNNVKDWQENMLPLFTENGEIPPAPPTQIDFGPDDKSLTVTKEQLDAHNNWVFIAKQRSWDILCLGHHVPKSKLALPTRLKGLPGFPGSSRYAVKIKPAEAVDNLEQLARRHAERVSSFNRFTKDQWQALLDEYDPPNAPAITEEQDLHERLRRQIGEGLRALTAHGPARTYADIAAEISKRFFRDAANLKKHLWENLSASGHPQDGRAARKMIEILNLAVEFALQPIRKLDGFEAYAAFVPEKRKAYGDVNGAMQEPSNETIAIPFTGLSVDAKGSCQYKAALCYRTDQTSKAEWSFQFCANENQDFRLPEHGAILKSKRQKEKGATPLEWNSTDGWTAVASRGGGRGGRKKAKRGTPKQVVRLQMWHADDNSPENPFRPVVLPLAFGKRQGRKFLWNYDFSLLQKSEYELELGEVKLLRDKPAGGSETKYYVTLSMMRTIPAATLKDKLERFAVKDYPAHHDILGADRGETVPLSYALVAPDGWFNPTRLTRLSEFQTKFDLWRKEITKWELLAKTEGLEKAGELPRFQITELESKQWAESVGGRKKLASWGAWLWQSLPSDGFGVVEPEHRWRMMRIGLQKAETQRQFATWSGELGKKEREIARALTGKVVRTILEVGSRQPTTFVLEKLTSAIPTRGGKGSRMSERQYEPILSTLEFRLNEAGLYRQPKDDRKSGSYHLRFIDPHFTSQTCSCCGLVHDGKFYQEIAASLFSPGRGKWMVRSRTIERELKTEYTVWSPRHGERRLQTDEELTELLNGRSAAQVLEPNKNGKPTTNGIRLVSIVEKCLPYRAEQHKFRCFAGCALIHADVQAALNIARKFVFSQESKLMKQAAKKDDNDESDEESSYRDDWQQWYKCKLDTVWNKKVG